MQEVTVRVPLGWPGYEHYAKAAISATLDHVARLHGMRGSLELWEEMTHEG